MSSSRNTLVTAQAAITNTPSMISQVAITSAPFRLAGHSFHLSHGRLRLALFDDRQRMESIHIVPRRHFGLQMNAARPTAKQSQSPKDFLGRPFDNDSRSEEHTSELH